MTSFYSAFETRFRGPRDQIKARLQAYTPFLEPFLEQDQMYPTIDLGCGRGEWLELLQDLGFRASGVDLDEGMLAIAKEHGLTVTAQDALLALIQLPSDSQCIVSGFHIAEHLPFEVLQKLVQEAYRVLCPGGLLILETPNPENIAVATNYFYLDPTHIKPLPPELMSFLPEYYGFCRSKIVRLQEDQTLLTQSFITVAQIIHGVSPDYAVVAQKEAAPSVLALWNSAFERSYGLGLGVLSERLRQIQEEQAASLHSKLQAQSAQLQAQSAQLQAQSAHFEAQTALWHSQYLSVLQSSSWKITAPLRSLKSSITRLRNRLKASLRNLVLTLLGSSAGSLFLRRHIGQLMQRIPFLDRRIRSLIVRVVGSSGFATNLNAGSISSVGGFTDELKDITQLTDQEREIFNRLESAIRTQGQK